MIIYVSPRLFQMSANTIALSIVLLAIAIAIAKWIRIRFKIFSKIFLPTSVIAGFLVLLLGPEVPDKVISREYGVFTEDILTVFKALPGLFIGKNIPDTKEIRHIAEPQVSFGQSNAWGRYIVGGGIMSAISIPLIAQLGLVTVIIISASIMSIWLFVGLVYFGRKGPEQVL